MTQILLLLKQCMDDLTAKQSEAPLEESLFPSKSVLFDLSFYLHKECLCACQQFQRLLRIYQNQVFPSRRKFPRMQIICSAVLNSTSIDLLLLIAHGTSSFCLNFCFIRKSKFHRNLSALPSQERDLWDRLCLKKLCKAFILNYLRLGINYFLLL